MRWLVANWKMNLSTQEAQSFFDDFPRDLLHRQEISLGVAPMAPLIPILHPRSRDTGIRLGAQNAHWEESGAFTGEVSICLLKELGCDFVIIGHSERRHLFGESIEAAGRRAAKVMQSDLTSIFCVGETEGERQARKTNDVLRDQLSPLLSGWEEKFATRFVIAYEPVWAIGSGRSAEPAQIAETHRFISELVEKESGLNDVPILYGGSVNPQNIGQILSLPRVHGALVGKASLRSSTFAELARAALSNN